MREDEIINGCRLGAWVPRATGTEHFVGGEYILVDGKPELRSKVKPRPPLDARSADTKACPGSILYEVDLVRSSSSRTY